MPVGCPGWVVQWAGESSHTKRVASSILSQGTYLACRFDAWSESIREATATDQCFFSLSFSLPPDTKISKHIIKCRFKKKKKCLLVEWMNDTATDVTSTRRSNETKHSSESAFSSIISLGLAASPWGRQVGCYLSSTDEATGRAWARDLWPQSKQEMGPSWKNSRASTTPCLIIQTLAMPTVR